MSQSEKISADIREAFALLKERTKYKYGDINLNRAIIVTSYLSDIADSTEYCGMRVFLCDLQSSFDYFLCIPDATKVEEKFLKCHREAMGST